MATMTETPDPDRVEELVAQAEYQGGGDYVRLCQGREVTIHAKYGVHPSDEAPETGATRYAQTQVIQTCSCGQAAKLEIAYIRPDGKPGTYTACAVCDAVHHHPRFSDGPMPSSRLRRPHD